MSALDKVRAAAKARAGGMVVVPEWGNLEVHYRPVKLGDVEAALAVSRGSQVRQNIEVFVRIAMDGGGKPLFEKIDALELLELLDPHVIGRVLRQVGIIADEAAAVDEAEKN